MTPARWDFATLNSGGRLIPLVLRSSRGDAIYNLLPAFAGTSIDEPFDSAQDRFTIEIEFSLWLWRTNPDPGRVFVLPRRS